MVGECACVCRSVPELQRGKDLVFSRFVSIYRSFRCDFRKNVNLSKAVHC